MSGLPVIDSERPLFDAIKKHEDLRAMVRTLGSQKFDLQNKLALKQYSGETQRAKIVREMGKIEETLAVLKSKVGEASVERQKADQILRRSASNTPSPLAGAVWEPRPMTAVSEAGRTPIAERVPFFNAAQLQHLKLLIVRVRGDELKMSARLHSALDLIAIVEPLIKKESGGK